MERRGEEVPPPRASVLNLVHACHVLQYLAMSTCPAQPVLVVQDAAVGWRS
jgi:hypothetical protein